MSKVRAGSPGLLLRRGKGIAWGHCGSAKMLHNLGPQRPTEDQGADTRKDQQSINPTLSPSSTQRGGVGL